MTGLGLGSRHVRKANPEPANGVGSQRAVSQFLERRFLDLETCIALRDHENRTKIAILGRSGDVHSAYATVSNSH